MLSKISEAISNNKIPAFAYSRVSTNEQAENGMSLEYQERQAVKYAEENGIEIVKLYSSSESAFKEGRKNFNRMLEEALAFGIKDILFKNTDRLARNEGFRIHLYELNTIFSEDSTAEEEVFLDVTSAFAKYWSNKISQGVRNAYNDKRERSIAPVTPSGYIWSKLEDNWVKDPAMVEALNFLFDTYDNTGISVKALAEEMNAKGFRSKKGYIWRASTVHGALINLAYAGKVKDKDGSLVEVSHETYVTWERYEERLSKMGQLWKGAQRRESQYALAGILTSEDGRLYTGDRKKNKYTYYVLAEKKRTYHSEAKLFSLIDNEIKNLTYDEGFSEFLKSEFHKVLTEVNDTSAKHKSRIEHKIAECNKRQKRILMLFEHEDIPTEMVRQELKEIKQEKKQLMLELQALGEVNGDIMLEVAEIIERLRKFPTEYEELGYKGKGALLKTMVDRIIFNGNTVEIEWTAPFTYIFPVL